MTEYGLVVTCSQPLRIEQATGAPRKCWVVRYVASAKPIALRMRMAIGSRLESAAGLLDDTFKFCIILRVLYFFIV